MEIRPACWAPPRWPWPAIDDVQTGALRVLRKLRRCASGGAEIAHRPQPSCARPGAGWLVHGRQNWVAHRRNFPAHPRGPGGSCMAGRTGSRTARNLPSHARAPGLGAQPAAPSTPAANPPCNHGRRVASAWPAADARTTGPCGYAGPIGTPFFFNNSATPHIRSSTVTGLIR